MKKADQWSGLVLLILAGFICSGSIFLPYGNIHNPGPGFFPLWLGIILGAMAIGSRSEDDLAEGRGGEGSAGHCG